MNDDVFCTFSFSSKTGFNSIETCMNRPTIQTKRPHSNVCIRALISEDAMTPTKETRISVKTKTIAKCMSQPRMIWSCAAMEKCDRFCLLSHTEYSAKFWLAGWLASALICYSHRNDGPMCWPPKQVTSQLEAKALLLLLLQY